MACAIVLGAGPGNLCFGVLAQRWAGRVRSANFLVPAVFAIPGACLFFIAVNVVAYKGLSKVAVTAAMFCTSSYLSPTMAIVMDVTEPRLRSRAAALLMATVKLFEMMAPLTVGFISDRSSLKVAMQIAWIAPLAADLFWWTGWGLLPPLPTAGGRGPEPSSSKGLPGEDVEDDAKDDAPTVWSMLCGGRGGGAGEAAPLAAAAAAGPAVYASTTGP